MTRRAVNDTYIVASGEDLWAGRAASPAPAPPPPPPGPPPPPPPAPSITLSSTGAATAGSAYAVTVTAANLTGPLTVTPERVSGPSVTFDPTTVLPAPGELVKLFNLTAAAAGTLQLRATAAGGIVSNEIDIVVNAAPAPGPTPPPPPPPPAGAWQVLSVAPHSRKVSNLGPGDGTISTFTTTKAVALDATSPTAGVTTLPAKGWNKLIQGERGYWYLCGGMHSNYPGSEVDRVTLPVGADTTMVTEMDVQPFRTPEGPFSGYFSGGCGYIHRQYNVPMADPSDWRPYIGHQWTMASWHPDWGLIVRAPHALQTSYPNGSYILDGNTLVGSHAQPGDTFASHTNEGEYEVGYVGLNWQTKKWTTWLPNLASGDYGGVNESKWVGHTGASDWNEFSTSMLFLTTGVSGRTYMKIWHRATGTLQDLGWTTAIAGSSLGSSGNGVLVGHLEGEKYLILLREQGVAAASASHRLYLFNRRMGTGDARFATLTIPPEAFTGAVNFEDVLSFTVDKNSRRIFWLVRPGGTTPMRFYKSTFDAPTTWTEIVITPGLSSAQTFIDAWKQPMMFRDGYLYLQDTVSNSGPYGWPDGAVTMRRAKVDNGEDLPAMTFTRYDYDNHNNSGTAFGLSANPGVLGFRMVKHVNSACRTPTGEHWICSGDMGGSHNSSMAKLTFSGTAPGDFLYTETMSEASFPDAGVGVYGAPFDGPTRMKRPVSPDDGAWAYSSSANPVPAMRDKFVFMRGTDGSEYGTNNYTRPMYANAVPPGAARDAWLNNGVDHPDIVAAMQADGWTNARLMVFDPVKNGFEDLNAAAWPFSYGSSFIPHPVTGLPQNSSRNGVFDDTTNCAFRITRHSGGLCLVKYDLTAQTIRAWNIASWVDTAGLVGPAGRSYDCSGLDPAVVDEEDSMMANKFGFFYEANGRWITGLPGHWEQKALWIDTRDGKLYGMSPQTGYLWCFETRGAETDTGNGLRIPFYPVGNRAPLVGTFPARKSLRVWPPVNEVSDMANSGNADTSMNSLLMPFKGGLLWLSNSHFTGGNFGHPIFAFWRRLGFTGDWTVVSVPREFAAQTQSPRSTHIDNDEVVLSMGGGNGEDAIYPNGAPAIPSGFEKYFWRLT